MVDAQPTSHILQDHKVHYKFVVLGLSLLLLFPYRTKCEETNMALCSKWCHRCHVSSNTPHASHGWSILHNARWTTSLHLPFIPWPLLDRSMASREHIATLPNKCVSTNELYNSITTVLLFMKHCFHHIWGEKRGSSMVRDWLAML